MSAAFDILLCLMILATAGIALFVRGAFAAIAFFIAFGNLLGLAWLALGAVNVALAEIAVGAGVTGVALILACSRLFELGDNLADVRTPLASRLGSAALCLGFTVMLAGVVLTIPPGDRLSKVVAPLLPGLGIENPVTGVLLAFRGYDTLLETFVLLGALVAAWSLTPDASRRLPPTTMVMTDPTSRIVAEAFTRLLAPAALIIAAYLVWVGSDLPGGAFQAGAVLAGALVVATLGGVVVLPRLDSLAARIALMVGPLTFLAIGLAGAALGGRFLAYPDGLEKTLIVTIEYALAISIAAGLALLAIGPPQPMPNNARADAR